MRESTMIESCMTEQLPETSPPPVPRAITGKPRIYILTSGIAKCANCGYWMEGKPLGRKTRSYACVPATKQHPTKAGCGRVSINADNTDHLIATKVLAYLAMPGRLNQLRALIAKWAESGRALADEVAATQARMRESGALRAKDLVSIESHLETNRVGLIHMRALRRQARKIELNLDAVDGFDTADRLADWWENTASNEEKHDLVRVLIEEVRVHPTAVRGLKGFQPERIEIVWQPGIVWDASVDVSA
jgi:hypothetical protein